MGSPLQDNVETLKLIKKLSGKERNSAMLAYASPVEKTAVDRGIVLFDLLVASYLAVIITLGFIKNPSALLPAFLFIPVTLFIADFIGQAFHKWLDSYASETNFLWGKAAQEFRKHHELPTNLNHVQYLNHIAAFGRLMGPMFIGACFVNWTVVPALGLNILFLLMVLLHATEIHKQAHRRNNVHWFIQRLQKMKIILRYEDHVKHHRTPFDSNYAVINGWSQILTDKTDFWKKMDVLWWKIHNELPRIWIQDPRSIPDSVLAELQQSPEKIPADLWFYAEAYPERLSTKVANTLIQPEIKS